MASFSWLHLTDLHWGMHEQPWLWPRMKEKFFQDLETLHLKSGPWDFVLFTGDLAYKGSSEEFRKVDEVLDRLWEHLHKLGSTPVLLAVPGNHDLVRPKASQPEVEVLRDWSTKPAIQATFWENPKSTYRKVVTKAFQNYLAWWEQQRLRSPDVRSGMLPGDFSVSIRKGTAQLGIVGLNTTFLQLTEGDYEGKLALSARQFHSACGGDGPEWAKKHHVCLLLTHQPPAWLSRESQEELNTEIADPGQFAAHLFGHLHEARYTVAAEGGAEPRRFWQGRSLFGLERFVGKSGEQLERLHGYSAGKLELRNDGTASLTFCPREVINLKGNKWKMVPDSRNYDLTDEHTKPDIISLLRPYQHAVNEKERRHSLRRSRSSARRRSSTQVLPVRPDRMGRRRTKLNAAFQGGAVNYALFESLERLRELGDNFKDRAFKPRQVHRKVFVDQPNAEIEVLEQLVNMSKQAQAEVVRCLATDTRTDTRDLNFRAWVKLKGEERQAAVTIANASYDRRKFAFRISFSGRIVDQGESVQIRWKSKMPGSVALPEDYWVFALNYFEKPAESLLVEAAFARDPVDQSFFAVTNSGREQPLNISAPVQTTIERRTWYVCSAAVKWPKDFYLLRWRLD